MRLLDSFRMALDYEPMSVTHKSPKEIRDMTNRIESFVLDADTSRMLAPVSYELVRDLESARRAAIPPFPRVWVEVDNVARISGYRDNTIKGDVVPRIGWLIDRHPVQHTLYRASYVGDLGYRNERPWIVPAAFYWDIEGGGCAWRNGEKVRPHVLLPLGVPREVEPPGVGYCISPGGPYDGEHEGRTLLGLLHELNGELRFVWAFLLMLNSGDHFQTTMGAPMRETAPLTRRSGAVLPAVEHRTLVVHLARRRTAGAAARAALLGVHKRYHSVRGHMRTYLNPDGTVRRRVMVAPHHRGDKALGVIEKTYEVRK